jgi:hypothetical protein
MSRHYILTAGIALLLSVGICAATANTTVVVSPNDSNHGDPNLLCRRASWIDIAIFFLGNYIAHAATITTLPGETWQDVTLATVRALLFPVSGVIRGVRAIQSLAIFGHNDLERAARARALAMVVKRDTPGDGKY